MCAPPPVRRCRFGGSLPQGPGGLDALLRERDDAVLALRSTRQCLASTTHSLEALQGEYTALLNRYDRLQKRMEQLVDLSHAGAA